MIMCCRMQQNHERCRQSSWLSIIFCLIAARIVALCESSDDSSTRTCSSDMEECKLYLAESSIPNAGLGVFTAVDIRKGETVFFGDAVFGIFDFELHNDYNVTSKKLLTKDYAWNAAHVSGDLMMEEAQRVSTLFPGPGMLCNCHFGLNNIAISSTRPQDEDDDIPHRKRNPGAGASFSPHHGNAVVYATADIPKGSELFLNYGERWFKIREKQVGIVPFANNYRQADKILNKMHALMTDESNSRDASVASNRALLFADIWSLLVTGKINNETATVNDILKDLSARHEASLQETSFLDRIKAFIEEFHHVVSDVRTCAALPKNINEVAKAAKIGSARYSVPHFIRSSEWLEENGMCMDNLKAGLSNIPNAGRGAFATKFLPQGSLVAPAPLLHIPDKFMLDMYILMGGGPYGQPKKLSSQKVARQLLVNYAYGHKNSSLLLLPYSSGVSFINHDSKNPNAFVRWSSSRHHKADYMTKSVEEMKDINAAGLMMEFVAARDILPGEEVTIDYGNDWQLAWETHVESWQQTSSVLREDYVSAREMNRDMAPPKLCQEEMILPYPANIKVTCYFDFGGRDEYPDVANDIHMSDIHCQLADYDQLIKNATLWKETEGLYRWVRNRHPCNLLARDDHQTDNETDTEAHYVALISKRNEDNVKRLVTGLPRKAITYVDMPYTSDIHLARAFRHEILLPDDMFSEAWKELS